MNAPLQESGNPPRVSTSDRVHRGLAALAVLHRVPVCNGCFAVERGVETQEGQVSARPAKQSPHCLAE